MSTLNARRAAVMAAHPSPSLDLRLTDGGGLDPRITYTGSGGTYFNSAGVLTAATTNVARFDFDPVTHLARGLLIEAASTNLLLQSEAFNASWGLAEATITANGVTSPAGTLTGDTAVPSVNNAFHIVYQAGGAVTSGATVTLSLFAKANGYNFIWVRFGDGGAGAVIQATANLSNGTFAVAPAASGTGAALVGGSISAVGGGWYRITLTGSVTTVTNYTAFLYPMQASPPATFAGNGTSGVALWGAQLEAGAFATSYFPTTTAAATRAADVATLPASSWYRGEAWTLLAEGQISALPSSSTPFGVLEPNDTTTNNRTPITLLASTAQGRINSLIGGSGLGPVTTANAVTPGVVFKLAAAQTGSGARIGLNGGAVVTSAWASAIASVTQIQLGGLATGTNALNGWLNRVRYWPRAMGVAELQAMTR